MENSKNRRWMDYSRVSKEYLDGVENFLNQAFCEKSNGETISCPCSKCVLYYQVNRAMAYDHLVVNGIMASYDTWFCHGESLNGSTSIEKNNNRQEALRGDDMRGMIYDVFGSFNQFMDDTISEREEIEPSVEENAPHQSRDQSYPEVGKFEQLMKDSNEELYPGCKKFSKLSFLLHLYRVKLLFKWSNEGCLFPTVGKSYGSVEIFKLDQKTLVQAHRYVLFNCESDVVNYYKNEHISEIKRLHRKRRLTQHQLDRLHFENFHEWFKEQVNELDLTSNISNDVKALARGPCNFARRFNAFHMNNGYRFRTKQYEEFMQTQNSGVMVVSMTESYASTSDNAPKSANVTYYGRLKDIVELNYYEEFKVVLFKCDWVDVTQGRGVMKDNLGFTLVNFSRLIHLGERESDEPFVFAGQAQQVIFVQDPEDHEWYVPRSIKPRDIFDMGEENSMRFDSSMQSDTIDLTILENICDLEHDNNDWVRGGVDGIEIDMG